MKIVLTCCAVVLCAGLSACSSSNSTRYLQADNTNHVLLVPKTAAAPRRVDYYPIPKLALKPAAAAVSLIPPGSKITALGAKKS